VLWSTNGCLLIAEVGDAPTGEPGPGPCARSELAVDDEQQPRLARRMSVTLTCVAAPEDGCRGTLRLRSQERLVSAPQKVRLPAGRTRTLTIRLKSGGLARLRRIGTVIVEIGDSRPTEPSLRM
jgi:hypothetical protein